MLIRFGGSGGRSIAWVLKSSEKFVLGSCNVDTSMFERSDGEGNVNKLLPGGKVYVVLDRMGDRNKPNDLSFGLKVVNQKGKEIGAGTKALLVTEKSVGLISIQAWFKWRGIEGQIGEGIKNTLTGMEIRPVFDIKASNIDEWLGKLEGIDGGGNLTNTIKWDSKDNKNIKGLDIKISSRWQSWCGSVRVGRKDKKLNIGGNVGNDIEGDYKNFNEEINLTVGSIKHASDEEKWALVPMGKPIMKINLSSGSFNKETIEGTLELRKDNLRMRRSTYMYL